MTMPTFDAGAARTTITPPVGVDLCGFGGRTDPSTGVHDDLRACALFVSDGSRSALFLTADIIGFHRDEVARIRAAAAAGSGVPANGVMVSCSHTHSGPATRCIRYLGRHDDAYIEDVVQRLGRAAAEARACARPARAGWGRIPMQIGVNRRQARAGRMGIGVNADGAVAAYADVLRVDGVDGGRIACLVTHAAHAVALRGDNLLISGDWPGFAQRALERELGSGIVALFQQGCCGNVNCRESGSFAEAEALGQALCHQVVAAYEEIETAPLTIAVACERLNLPLLPIPAASELACMHRDLLADAEAKATHENRGVRWMAEGAVMWCEELIALAAGGADPRCVPFEVQAIRVGDCVVVGLPGEVFVEYALQIDAESPLRTAVAAYTNGNIGYVPDARAYPKGGYEVETAIRFYGTTMPAPASEKLITAGAQRVIAAVCSRAMTAEET